ncbi:homeobox protein Rhox13-like [Peromyscus leucopus]|uniref:homeobox protein Rhox13-like n=1 Tax=Peromyscus leucopus TaxID=10041 RepID=UPI0010A19B3B|nr:homeobox protein Rhox13-like [Peromyscus leucopus]
MARKLYWRYIYIVRNENGEEIAQVPTLEAALAMVGGNPSGGDAGCVTALNNSGSQFREAVIRIPRRRSSQRRRRTTLQFTLWQVEEMEKMFKETKYPDALTRKELAQALNIPEVKVKTWFVHRRAEEKKRERSVVLQSIPPRIEKVILLREREGNPQSAIYVQGQDGNLVTPVFNVQLN